MATAAVTVLGDYTVYDETQDVRAPAALRDASRPFVVIQQHYRGYKGGLRNIVVGRYTSRKAALAAIRRHSAF